LGAKVQKVGEKNKEKCNYFIENQKDEVLLRSD
jgi:hypothetical protein